MITNLSLPFDMEKKLLAFSQEHRKDAPVMGESLKIYIPLLMLNITQFDNSDRNKVSAGSYQTFLNDISCRPKVQNTIKTQNNGICLKNDKRYNSCSWYKKF